MIIYGDIETFSLLNLKECGAYVYATNPSTGLHFFCYAVDDDEVQVWRPGDPVPTPFTAAAVEHNSYSWWNWSFERNIYAEILVPRHGFAPIPLENQDCAQRRALANAYPAELGLCCEALGLPYRKDPEARKAMLRLAQPKKHKYKTAEAREQDLALLLRRCVSDVESLRACYLHPRMSPLSADERPILLLDAKVNGHGVRLNVPFVEAGRMLAVAERNAVNVRLSELTSGVVTSVFQRDRILAAVNASGHSMTKLSKRVVAATLAHKPEDYVRELPRCPQ